MKYLTVAAALVLLGVVLFQIHQQRALSRQLATLEQSVNHQARALPDAQPEARAARAPAPVVRPAPVEARAAPAPAPTASDPPSGDREEPRQGPSSIEIAAATDREFVAQPVDPTWARDAKSALRTEIEAVVPAGLLSSVECRKTLCKAEVGGDAAYGISTFVNQLLRGEKPRTWQGAVTVLKTGEGSDGHWTGVAYFARDGESMPVVE